MSHQPEPPDGQGAAVVAADQTKLSEEVAEPQLLQHAAPTEMKKNNLAEKPVPQWLGDANPEKEIVRPSTSQCSSNVLGWQWRLST